MRLIEKLNMNECCIDEYGYTDEPIIKKLNEVIERLNTIGAVVRCSECKHLIVHGNDDIYASCSKTGYVFLPFDTDTRTHFCSYGERKDGDG